MVEVSENELVDMIGSLYKLEENLDVQREIVRCLFDTFYTLLEKDQQETEEGGNR